MIVISLLLLTSLTLSATSEFSLKGDPCAKYDRCQSKSVVKTCSCVKDCQAYGTCCHDVKKPKEDVPGYQCYTRRVASPVFAKRSCSDEYRGHVANRLACFDDEEDEMDVSNNLLMTSRKTKVTYWSKHCAACSNEAAVDLEYWNVEVFCPRHKEVNGDVIRTNLAFDQDKRQWGLMIDGEFLSCSIRYAPSIFVNEVKHCPPSMISSCPDNYTNEPISAKCSQYYAERKVKNAELYYKNIHCAICNNAEVKELECPGMHSPEESIEERDVRDMVKEVFTNGEWLDNQFRWTCSKGYSYDPGREKCRSYEIKVEQMPVQSSSAHNYRKASIAFVVALFSLIL